MLLAVLMLATAVNYTVQTASHYDDVKNFDTEKLRSRFVMEKVMEADKINVTYSLYDRLLYEIGRRDILVDATDFGESITLRLAVRADEYEAFSSAVDAMTNGRLRPKRGADRFDRPKAKE